MHGGIGAMLEPGIDPFGFSTRLMTFYMAMKQDFVHFAYYRTGLLRKA
jgi:hypothetical protein